LALCRVGIWHCFFKPSHSGRKAVEVADSWQKLISVIPRSLVRNTTHLGPRYLSVVDRPDSPLAGITVESLRNQR
jgi:hypothetical protein